MRKLNERYGGMAAGLLLAIILTGGLMHSLSMPQPNDAAARAAEQEARRRAADKYNG